MNKKGFTLWFTGLPCAGKTTVADIVAQKLRKRGVLLERLDGDIVRKSLTKDLGFSKEDRDKNIERVTFVAKLLSRNKIAVLASFISPYRSEREKVKKEVTNFTEVFVDCPLEICEKRDVKGMFKKARKGEIKGFTGVSDPYENPLNPEIRIKTGEETPEQSADKVIRELEKSGFISRADNKIEFSENEENKIRERLVKLGHM